MSGTDLSRQIERISGGEWKPGPGSVYLLLGDLLRKGLIAELPKREGNVRRYIISSKGKDELARLSKETEAAVSKQLRLLGVYSSLAGKGDLKSRILSILGDPEARG